MTRSPEREPLVMPNSCMETPDSQIGKNELHLRSAVRTHSYVAVQVHVMFSNLRSAVRVIKNFCRSRSIEISGAFRACACHIMETKLSELPTPGKPHSEMLREVHSSSQNDYYGGDCGHDTETSRAFALGIRRWGASLDWIQIGAQAMARDTSCRLDWQYALSRQSTVCDPSGNCSL